MISKTYVVSTVNFFENDIKSKKIIALDEFDAVKKMMVLLCEDNENAVADELAWQNSDDYPKNLDELEEVLANAVTVIEIDNDSFRNNIIKDVIDFHRAFKQEFKLTPKAELSEEEIKLRFNLMKEENEEYLEAAELGDLIGIADALGDQLYILCGTIIKHGLQDKIGQVFNAIHESNMTKLNSDGTPLLREDGKILKSSNYVPVDLTKIIND